MKAPRAKLIKEIELEDPMKFSELVRLLITDKNWDGQFEWKGIRYKIQTLYDTRGNNWTKGSIREESNPDYS